MKRCLIISPFVILASGLMLVSGTVAGDTMMIALSIALKAFAAVILLTLLTSTEKFHRLIEGMRSLRLPSLLGVLSSFVYRYMFILSDEMMRTKRARMSRTPGRPVTGRIKTYGNQAATVFLRSWERSQVVYDAMCSRGFSGKFPLRKALDFSWYDAIFLATLTILFLTIRVFV
jgi:cobalt/nickel transport system permease protein